MGAKRQILRRLPGFLQRVQSDASDPVDLYFAYRLLLERLPDDEGLRGWTPKLGDGGMSRRQLVWSFLTSLEFRRKFSMRETERVQLDGFAMFVDCSDHAVSSAIINSHSYEPHVTRAIEASLKPDSVFVDIGASIGWFLLLAAARSPNGKVIGFEPNHNNLQLVYRSVAENGFQNVTVFPYAATEKRALLQLGYDAAYGFVHGLEERSDDPFVQGVPVDELLANEPRIDIIKMDIEGHEPVAFRGMQATIAKHRPLLFTEFHPQLMRKHAGQDAAEYFDTLVRAGYAVSALLEDGTQIPQSSAATVLELWRSVNEESHLDLIARPV